MTSEKPRDLHGMFERDDSYGGGGPQSVVCGTASVLFLRPNQRRKRVIIINDSDTVMYVSKSQNAVLNAGIRLNANGGTLIDEIDAYGYLYRGPWAAITSAATKTLAFMEE